MTKRQSPFPLTRAPLTTGLALMLLGSMSAEAWAAQPGADSRDGRSVQAQPHDKRACLDGGSRGSKLKTKRSVYDERLSQFRRNIKERQAKAESNVAIAGNGAVTVDTEQTDHDTAPAARRLSVRPTPPSNVKPGDEQPPPMIHTSAHASGTLAKVQALQAQRTAAKAQAEAMTRLQKSPQRRADNMPAPIPRKPPCGPLSQLAPAQGRSVPTRTTAGIAPRLASKDLRRSFLQSTASSRENTASHGAGSRKVETIVDAQLGKLGPKPQPLKPSKRVPGLYELPAHREIVRKELALGIGDRRNQALAKRDTHARDRAPLHDLAKSRHALASGGPSDLSHGADPLNLHVPGVLGAPDDAPSRSSQAVTGQRTKAYSAPHAYERSKPSRSVCAPAPDAPWRMSAVEALALAYQVSGLSSVEHSVRDLAPETAPSLGLADALAAVIADERQCLHLEIDPTQSRWREEIVAWRAALADLAPKSVVRFEQDVTLAELPQRESICAAILRIEDRADGTAAYAVVRRAHDGTPWEMLASDDLRPADANGHGPTAMAPVLDENELSNVTLVVYRAWKD
jgi:hypothetical protein